VFYLECEPPASLSTATQPADEKFSADSNTAAHLPQNVDHGSRPSEPPVQSDHADSFFDPVQSNVIEEPSSPDQPDIIEHWVSGLKGQVISIRTPRDCARAIQRVRPHDTTEMMARRTDDSR
jgi:hypothetical protein